MTISLEHIHTEDGTLARNFDTLRALVPDTGGRSLIIRQGVATFTWPGGSPLTSTVAITHGLGMGPVSVQITSLAASNPVVPMITASSSTTFTARGRLSDGTSPGAGTTQQFYWVAFG